MNDTIIRVMQGDITDHRADVLVNSTDHKLSINGKVLYKNSKMKIHSAYLCEMSLYIYIYCSRFANLFH